MEKFELPSINIERFSAENIVTTSRMSLSAQKLKTGLSSSASEVNVVDWSLYAE